MFGESGGQQLDSSLVKNSLVTRIVPAKRGSVRLQGGGQTWSPFKEGEKQNKAWRPRTILAGLEKKQKKGRGD